MDLLVKNGIVFTATDSWVSDIAIDKGKIVQMGVGLRPTPKTKIIDATGKFVIPGAIDVHVHLQLPFCGTVSSDDWVSGTRAAACGGVTTVIDFGMQDLEKGLQAGLESRMAETEGKTFVDYSLHGIIKRWDDKIEKELKPSVEKLGVSSFKMFMVYKNEGMQSDDAALFRALRQSEKLGATICVHAESDCVMQRLIDETLPKGLGAYGHAVSRPNFIEEEAIQRAIKWTEVTGGQLYVVHMSTGGGADMIKRARESGIRAFSETCPQYLLFDDSVFKKADGHMYATCPQIKKPEDSVRLWQGLKNGEVSVVSTDTCTFSTTQKEMWNGDIRKIPFGMPGVETLLPSIFTHGFKAGRFNMNHLVNILCTNPAKMMGLYPTKGTIAIGADGDLTIIDPNKQVKVETRKTRKGANEIVTTHKGKSKPLATNCDWNQFSGQSLFGFPDWTISRGAVVAEDRVCTGSAGHGRFVRRAAGGTLG